MIDEVLVSRGFKWQILRHTKPYPASFTKEEAAKSVGLAMSLLPEDKPVIEVMIKIDTEHIPRAGQPDLMDLETVIYWKEE